jgi:threonine synthase
MNFIETRGNKDGFKKEVTFSEAILSPSASFGGLYVPQNLPTLDESFYTKGLSYKEVAKKLLNLFEIDIDESVVDDALNLYDKFDNPSNPTPVVKIKDDLFVNELYHGPTRAFKDMALQPFGHILSNLAKSKDENYLILAATSGDTGPATLESFKNKSGVKVVCLYPDGGTSDVQRLQMVTEDAKNLKIIGIKGNFDDAQHALKTLLASQSFKDALNSSHTKLSAANSVNFGRIIFQIIYHIKSYLALLEQGEIEKDEKIYITVPSGNFGNALGAYYAKKMGLPIEKILITSNANNVLKELIQTGEYDIRDKNLILTLSPAMDILKSSNVERVLFDLFGANRTKEWMESLNEDGFYKLQKDELAKLQEHFEAVDSDDLFAKETIKNYCENGYLMDPHTATCLKAYGVLNKKPLINVICSTAEWTKFAPTIYSAINDSPKKVADYDALISVSKVLNTPIVKSISELFNKDIVHDIVIDKDDIEDEILKFIAS